MKPTTSVTKTGKEPVSHLAHQTAQELYEALDAQYQQLAALHELIEAMTSHGGDANPIHVLLAPIVAGFESVLMKMQRLLDDAKPEVR